MPKLCGVQGLSTRLQTENGDNDHEVLTSDLEVGSGTVAGRPEPGTATGSPPLTDGNKDEQKDKIVDIAFDQDEVT